MAGTDIGTDTATISTGSPDFICMAWLVSTLRLASTCVIGNFRVVLIVFAIKNIPKFYQDSSHVPCRRGALVFTLMLLELSYLSLYVYALMTDGLRVDGYK